MLDVTTICHTDCNGNCVADDDEIGSGAAIDCNTNAFPDECDISSGTSFDCDLNGVPDECIIGVEVACESSKATAGDDASALASFGQQVAISGEVAMVGAPLFDTAAGADAGAVFVFAADGAVWQPHSQLVASDAEPGAVFGPVAIDGSWAVIGAPRHDGTGTDSGQAYVFIRDGTGAWSQVKILVPADPESDDLFGASVGIYGSHIVVGAPMVGPNQLFGTGKAYVFERNQGGANNWGQMAKLIALDGQAGAKLGSSVVIEGDWVVAGAPGDSHSGFSQPGSAYVFERNQFGSNAWGQWVKLPNLAPNDDEFFGSIVSLDDDFLFVGIPSDDGAGADAGAVDVFRRDEGGANFWGHVQTVLPSAPLAGAMFGSGLGVSGDVATVGAPFDTGSGPGSGSAYVFRFNGTAWVESDRIVGDDTESGDEFGTACAIDGNTAVVGAIGDNDNCPAGEPGCRTGSAYVVTVAGPDCNANCMPDSCDIYRFDVPDINNDGIPDGCQTCTVDEFCDDGRYCNGQETCDITAQRCVRGAPPCAGEHACCEASQTCDLCGGTCGCDDGLSCNGEETCDDGTCLPGTPYCAQGDACSEDTHQCSTACDDDFTCDDGLFCNGAEACVDGVCVLGLFPCSDALGCFEGTDTCGPCDDDEQCDDDRYCNGAEACRNGTCIDGLRRCGNDEGCDELSNSCVPCDADGDCNDGQDCTVDSCAGGVCGHDESTCAGACCLPLGCIDDTAEADCIASGGTYLGHGQLCDGNPDAYACVGCDDACPTDPYRCEPGDTGCWACDSDAHVDDGFYCNGAETCALGHRVPGMFPCQPGFGCREETDDCGPCENDAECDDGLYCNGHEACSNGLCVARQRPCVADGEACCEQTDTCDACGSGCDCDDGLDCTVDTCTVGSCVYDDAACLGACCLPLGCLDVTAEAACLASNGTYLGHERLCDGNLDADVCIGCDDECPLDPDKCQSGTCGCGVSDACNCGRPAPVTPSAELIDGEPSTKNRFLSFVASDVQRSLAVRVTFVSLPPPFDQWDGTELWVGRTSQVSEAGADVIPTTGSASFVAAQLRCTPLFQDWSSLGTVHVFHEGIIPNASYLVDVVDETCDIGDAASFSAALPMTTATWGDTVLDLSETPPLPPNGPPVDVVDALAVLGAFSSALGAIRKARADLEPACLDLTINVSDALSSLAGFSGIDYPFVPTTLDPCDSTCSNPLP